MSAWQIVPVVTGVFMVWYIVALWRMTRAPKCHVWTNRLGCRFTADGKKVMTVSRTCQICLKQEEVDHP